MIPAGASITEHTLTVTTSFSTPTTALTDDFISVNLDESTGVTTQQGYPMLPTVTRTFELPWGSKITMFTTIPSKVNTQQLSIHVQPVPTFSTVGTHVVEDTSALDTSIYSTDEAYPSTWFDYATRVGLNSQGEHVLYVSIHLHPVRYRPLSKTIESIEEISISLTYEPGQKEQVQPLTITNDLLIIAPEEFIPALADLEAHKEALGVQTTIFPLDILHQLYGGRDNAEKIKYCIFDYVTYAGVKNVLLVGDIKKLPIRHVDSYPWGDDFGGDILSDLYYADIYNSTYEFCDWDANHNDVFGELIFGEGFPRIMEDIDGVDLYPDVHIGRLPCSTIEEVELQVDKIRVYENITSYQTWFQHIILVGGDTFSIGQGSQPFVYEGEITNEKVAQQLPDFEKTFLWSSKRNLNPLTFNLAMTKGAGFFSYAGHGFEHGWGTYRPNWLTSKMGLIQHMYYSPMMKGIKNQHRLPIMFFDACLTAKLDFNVSDLQRYYPRVTPVLVALGIVPNDPNEYLPCFAWNFLNKADGGAIAAVGATRPAYTMVGEDGVYGGAGYLDVYFFKAYEEGVTLGEMMHQAQLDYLNYVGLDYFTIEEFMLLGDPSLKVGGDPNGSPFF